MTSENIMQPCDFANARVSEVSRKVAVEPSDFDVSLIANFAVDEVGTG